MLDLHRNFIELLSLRYRDIQWYKFKLDEDLEIQKQWTSPDIQNELAEILEHCVLDEILNEVS